MKLTSDQGIRKFILDSKGKLQYYVAAIGTVGFLTTIKLYDPRIEGNLPTCPWLCLTGTHCPGCGTMRALKGLMELDIPTALSNNVLTVLFVPVFVYFLVFGFLHTHKVITLPDIRTIDSKWIIVLAIFVLLFWIARNISIYPFNLLAPIPQIIL